VNALVRPKGLGYVYLAIFVAMVALGVAVFVTTDLPAFVDVLLALGLGAIAFFAIVVVEAVLEVRRQKAAAAKVTAEAKRVADEIATMRSRRIDEDRVAGQRIAAGAIVTVDAPRFVASPDEVVDTLRRSLSA